MAFSGPGLPKIVGPHGSSTETHRHQGNDPWVFIITPRGKDVDDAGEALNGRLECRSFLEIIFVCVLKIPKITCYENVFLFLGL